LAPPARRPISGIDPLVRILRLYPRECDLRSPGGRGARSASEGPAFLLDGGRLRHSDLAGEPGQLGTDRRRRAGRTVVPADHRPAAGARSLPFLVRRDVLAWPL